MYYWMDFYQLWWIASERLSEEEISCIFDDNLGIISLISS